MPYAAIRQWKSTGKTCTFSEYLDLIAPAQEEYIRKCTDGLTASAAHRAVNHQETWPYGLRDFTLGVVSSWDLDDVMDSKSYEEMPQKYGGSFDQAVERLTTFSQTACNAINTIWELQALNIPVIYERKVLKPVLPTLKRSSISLLPSQRQKAAPVERQQALSANRGLPPVLSAGALSLSVRNDGRAQSPSRTTSMEAPEAPLASWTLSMPGMPGVVEYA